MLTNFNRANIKVKVQTQMFLSKEPVSFHYILEEIAACSIL